MTKLCPYGMPGDRIWVRENWRTYKDLDHCKPRNIVAGAAIRFESDNTSTVRHPEAETWGKLRPSIFMPRWASRILLEITAIKVERVQDISLADAIAEGMSPVEGARGEDSIACFWQDWSKPLEPLMPWPIRRYRVLWDQLNARRGFGWRVNPWVWSIHFRRIKP